MVTEVRIYYEGSDRLRAGFSEFFNKVVGGQGVRVRPVAGGGRDSAQRDFRKALQTHPTSRNILLIDSERPDDGKLFEGLRLPASCRGSVFWMVQLMESWFLADPEALKRHYKKLNEKALKDHRDVEGIPKARVARILKQATQDTGRPYDRRTGAKTIDAPKILATLDPGRVRKKARNCELLLNDLEQTLTAGSWPTGYPFPTP